MSTKTESTARTWLAYFNGRGQLCTFSMRDLSTEELGQLQKDVAQRFGGGPNDYAELFDLERCEKEGDVPYDWGLASSEGAYYVLFQLPGITDEQIKKAKAEIRWKHDVVSMRVKKIRTLDNGQCPNTTASVS